MEILINKILKYWLTVEKLIIARVGGQILAILRPVNMSDETWVALKQKEQVIDSIFPFIFEINTLAHFVKSIWFITKWSNQKGTTKNSILNIEKKKTRLTSKKKKKISKIQMDPFDRIFDFYYTKKMSASCISYWKIFR